jgi:hypothetical protein
MRISLLSACLTLLLGAACAAPVTFVQDGKSDYAIYLEANAPSSVKSAATELQTYVEKVTGAKLALVNAPCEPMICLGLNAAATAAKLDLKNVPLEGWRLAIRGRNLYLLGPDTADGALTPQGGTSNGTLNGTYAFIEQFLGVRWLMPGPHGDYIPKMASVTIPDQDLQGAPFFLNRRVPYTQERTAATKQWWARQRLGWSLALNHGHNWTAIKPEEFNAHPEWFAEEGGVRVPPTGRYKLCVTNQGLIEAFAQAAIAHFDAHPEATCFSLSPSDSAGWCQCPDCKALYETDPNGNLSVTPAIIQFYNRVAQIVARKYPQKVLAGYVYAQYVYPPSKPFKLASNVFLVWAPSFDYGFKLYRPEMQQRWDALAPQWIKVTSNIAYYDLPNCVHNELGAPNPPGLEILEFLYPRLKQRGFKGVYVYGNPAWGHAGPMNYLLAKLAWDPGANVQALFNEYTEKCYAEGAPEMKQFYTLLDEETKQYFIANPTETYVLREGRLKDVYARNYAELERLYRAAEAKITDPEAQARLAMMGDNLTVLHWNLRQAKLLTEPEKSSFYLNDKDFFAFMKANPTSLALAPAAAPSRAAVTGEKLTARPAGPLPAPPDAPMTPFLLRGPQRVIITPTAGGVAEITFSSITSRGGMVKYQVYDAAGALSDQGVMSAEVPIRLPAGPLYYQLIIAGGSHSFALAVKDGAWAVYHKSDEKGLHFLSRTTPLHFEAPAGVSKFTLWLASDAPGETAAATLYAPDGRKVASFDTSQKSVDMQQISAGANDAGWWTLVFDKPATGVVDDVWIKQGEGLPGFFALDPKAALGVR